MHELIGGLTPPVALAILAAVLLLLAWLARMHAGLGLAIGLVFLAVPVALWVFFDRRFFQSDGSAAGLVMFAFYALAGVVAGTLGVAFAGASALRLARGERATRFGRGLAFAVLGGVAMVLAGLAAYRLHGAMVTGGRLEARNAQPSRVVRVVPVKDRYAFAWEARGEAPALALAFPAAHLQLPNRDERSMQETRDGPRVIELFLGDALVPYATLQLHRDVEFVDDAVLDALEGRVRGRDPGVPAAFWVERDGGGWKLLGFQCTPEVRSRLAALPCHHPEAPLARAWPRAYGLEKVRLHAAQDRWNARCDMSFHFRDRVARVSSRSACFDAGSVSALAAAGTLLARAVRDAESPPPPAERLARAERALAACDVAQEELKKPADPSRRRDPADRADQACAFALALVAPELEASPAEAVALMLRTLEARPSPGVQDAPYVDALIARLDATGRAESREALRAHALRALLARGEPKAGEKVHASRAAVAALAPRMLAADDPAYERALAALATTSADGPEAEARYLAVVQGWHEKAVAAAPASELAFRTRYRLCLGRLGANVERPSLGACADEMMAAWESRAAAGKPFDDVHGEVELAASIARMYYSFAYAAPDFAAGLAGVRRVHERSIERLGVKAEYDVFFRMLQNLEAELAAKARGR